MREQTYKLIVFLGVVGLSASSILAKLATAPGIILALYRTLLTILILAPFALSRKKEIKALSGKELLLCLGGGICFGMHFALYCEAVKYTNIASATILIDCEVLFVAPVARLLFCEKPHRNGILGILLTLSGSLAIVISGLGMGKNVVYGNLLALAGAFFLAMFTMIGKVSRTRLSNSVYSFLAYSGSTVFLLFTALLLRMPLLGYGSSNFLIALGFTAFCTFGGHFIFSWSLKYIHASFVSTAKLMEPILASLFAFFFFGQIPAATVIAGGIIVILGVFVFSKESVTEKNA